MNADAIVAKILEDARAVAAQTLSDANARADQMKKRAEDEVIKHREQTMAAARSEMVELRGRMLRMAELDQRKALLAAKREVIDQAFEAALAKMSAMPAETKKRYLEKLLVKNAEGDEEIVVSDADAALFDESFLSGVNAALKSAGKAGRLRLSSERREIGGGFILKRSGMEVNCAFRALMSQIRPSLEAEVAGMLFDSVR